MLKRLFGLGGKKAAPTPPAPPARARLWDKPALPYEDYFALHLHGLTLEEAEAAVREHYLLHRGEGEEGALLVEAGGWVTAYFPIETVRGVGFNRLASLIAREAGAWVVGYRIFGWQGIDAHIFHGEEHIDQLAFAQNEIEFEPEEAAPFAPLAEVGAVVPRAPTQHPLDFHFALLAALGIEGAALGWAAARARYEAGWAGARLVRGSRRA